MFNTVNADIFGAFNEATMTIVTTALGFDAFVDGAAMLNLENLEGVTIFGFVNPADMAKLRKALKDDLKYVEAYAKQGYVGTVGGINIYTKKNAGNRQGGHCHQGSCYPVQQEGYGSGTGA